MGRLRGILGHLDGAGVREHRSEDGRILFRMGWDEDGSLGRLGYYHVIAVLDGVEFARVSAESREACVLGLRVALLHELVRRGDVLESGSHICEFCPYGVAVGP